MADIDVKELASNLLSELKEIATGGNSKGSSGQNYGEGKETNSRTLDISKVSDALDAVAKKLTEFATQVGINVEALKAIPGTALGYGSTTDTSKAFSDALKRIPGELGNIATRLEQLRLQAATANNVGIGQGDAKTLESQFQAAGYKDFIDGLKGVTDSAGNFKSSLAGLGYGADESTRRFNDFSKELSGKQGIQELIQKNIIQATDVPKLAMIAAQGKTSALDTPASRDKLVQEMVREAQMISQMSNAYGISKQAIMDNAIANNENTEAQIRQGALADDAARRAMRTAQAISIPGGKSLSDLVGKLSSGARLSKEDRAMLSVGTMGMGGQLTSAVKDVQRTKNLAVDDPQRRAAEDRLAGVEAEIRARQISPEGQRLAQSMKEGPQRAALEKMISEGRSAAEAERKIRQDTGVGYAESAKIAQQNLGAAQVRGEKGQLSGANPPEANTGAKVSETLAGINFAFIKNAAAVSAILAELNVKLGESAYGFERIKKALTAELGPGPATETVDEKKNRLRPGVTAAMEAINPTQPRISDDERRRAGINADGSIAGPVSVTTPNVNVTSPNVTVNPTNPTNPSGNPANTTPTMRRRPDGTAEEIPQRSHGTKGETGLATEPKDVIAQLHKGERVLSVDEVSKYTDMMSANATSMIDGITGKKNTGQAGGIDMTKPIGTVNTTVSSASKQLENYTIKAGDTLTKIAKDTGISIQDIMKANPSIKDKDKIYTGAELELPTIKVPPITLPSTNSVNNVQDSAQKKQVQVQGTDYASIKAQYDKLATSPAATVEGLASLKTQMDAAMKNQATTVAPAIPPVTAAVPKALTSVTKSDKTSSIIDKQLAKAQIDIGNLSGKLPNAVSNSNAKTPTIQTTPPVVNPEASIKKVFDSVSTSISSVTGGGSTTRKSVQTEDSKSAQAQLETLMSQYTKDRAAIGNKISESLGPDAKKGDVLKELKVNPEAIALEAQMKSMSRDLSSRINAGTSTETTFESGIQRGNIVVPESTSVPITDAVKGFDPILGEYEKDPGDEEPKTINLNDSEPKTKDLHDQLIQLNSSIRQLVEHSASGVGLAESQIKATRSLSGNRFA